MKLRTVSEHFFDWIASKNRRNYALAALSVPAIVTGLVVTVHPGDTLSALAAQHCSGNASDWTGIYHANANVIGADPNLIVPGQRLMISCKHADPPGYTPSGQPAGHPSSGGKIWGVTYGYPNYCGDGDGDGWDRPCGNQQQQQGTAPVASSAITAGPAQVSTAGDSSFQACVISRESGGNSQIWNASGHYGLYQFSASTWAAYGGNPADFGHASAAEQTQVFDNAMATAGGAGNWAPYDGC